MKNKVQNIIISYWFKELDYNPSIKIKEIEDSFKNIIDMPFLFNEEKEGRLVGMPRIEGISKSKKYFFNMSLINATLIINCQDEEDILLTINNYLQLVFDILNDTYNVRILYTSVKLEMINEMRNSVNYLKEKYHVDDDNIEELNFKKGLVKDDYYINYYVSSSREYNFQISNTNGLEKDIIDRSMLISLSEASLKREYVLTILEINDRYAFNQNKEYTTTKNSLRGMILQLQELLKEK